MKIFNYHPLTGEYMGETEADESPLEPGEYLLPAYSTPIAPPSSADGFVPVFNKGEWSQVADHRGEVWFDGWGQRINVEDLGVMPEADWTITAPPADGAKLAELVRAERDARIAGCDWTQISDTPLNATQKTAWKVYRQALRDVTGQPGFPQQIDWPVEPGKP